MTNAALRRPWARRVAVLALVASFLQTGCAGPRAERHPSPEPVTPGQAPVTQAPPASVPNVPTPLPPPEVWKSVSKLRIGLAVAAASVLVAGSTSWTLRTPGGHEIAREDEGARLRVLRLGVGSIEVLRVGSEAPMWTGGPGDTLLLQPSGNGMSGWAGRWYRGTFRIFASRPEGVTLVNEIDLESYLRGVLPNEIGNPPPSDFEAVKAQAVAARSYTLSYIGRRAALGFDLFATVEDQVYAGTAKENSQSNRALEMTRGEVLVSGDEPIRALYSSACGGRTANVEDVWPWPWTPYLRSVRDAGPDGRSYCDLSANYRWREEWTASEFMDMLRDYGPQEGGALAALSGDLLDVRVASRGRSGRVRELAVTTTEGEWRVAGDRVRWAVRRPGQTAILRSSFFKIGVVRDDRNRPESVIASGAGNGHGIGLCQWGAMGMARAGLSYREILRHYYARTTLRME
jgi:stage II sporulation protein D (peptidoglycan lytic transglycosylase)